MPIKFNCSCGQVLSVPDSMAGKTGKCPKCQKSVKIPGAAGEQASAQGKPAGAPAGAAPKPSPAASPSVAGMEQLLDEAGLKKKTGPVCPKCDSPIVRNAAICTKCGYNFESGEQLTGFNVAKEQQEFRNEFLQEAANNMRREDVMGARHAKSGMPWWMVIAFLFGALCIGGAGVLIVDQRANEPQPESTLIGKIQRQSIAVIIGTTFILMGSFIGSLANLSVLIFAFQQSIGKGLMCMFIPLYIVYYGIRTWADNASGIKGMVIAAVIGGFGAYLYFANGGIKQF